jgi:hypothetical protein
MCIAASTSTRWSSELSDRMAMGLPAGSCRSSRPCATAPTWRRSRPSSGGASPRRRVGSAKAARPASLRPVLQPLAHAARVGLQRLGRHQLEAAARAQRLHGLPRGASMRGSSKKAARHAGCLRRFHTHVYVFGADGRQPARHGHRCLPAVPYTTAWRHHARSSNDEPTARQSRCTDRPPARPRAAAATRVRACAHLADAGDLDRGRHPGAGGPGHRPCARGRAGHASWR